MLGKGERLRRVGLRVIVFGLLAGSDPASAKEPPSPVRVRDGFAAAAVRRALPAVQRRLANAECRRILVDFSDAQGKTLQALLEEHGQALEEYLGGILFYDGSALPGCGARKVDAFTSPGSRVIFVCAPKLVKRHGSQIEALIIHEMLHSLGLGEGPPSPAEITARIVERCGL